ncbi:MAG: sugar ABC transporter substrate-binding protein, partial [Actinomycetota bacterium]|nr:sugar ABC transporter substrate-binding protein [Actinomycetota bacterium]
MRKSRWTSRVAAVASVALVAGSAIATGSATASARVASRATFGVNATGTVTFWARAATDGVTNALVKKFNATHPHLKIVLHLTQPNEASSELATAIRAGDAPDLVGLNDINVPAFSREGALLNITPYVKALPYKSALSPGHMKLAQYNGQQYGVPYLADLSVLWYNTKLFKEAGISGPPTTFAAMLSDARKVGALGHGNYGLSFAGDCQGCLGFTMLPSIWASGQHLINGPLGKQTANVAHNAPLKALLNVYAQIWKAGLAPHADLAQNGTTWGDDFAQGNIGMLPGDYGFVTKYLGHMPTADFAVAPLPGMNGGPGSTFDGGDDFVIPAGAKNASGAWEVVQWFLAIAQQRQYPALGDTPVRSDVLTPSFLKQYPYDAVAL